AGKRLSRAAPVRWADGVAPEASQSRVDAVTRSRVRASRRRARRGDRRPRRRGRDAWRAREAVRRDLPSGGRVARDDQPGVHAGEVCGVRVSWRRIARPEDRGEERSGAHAHGSAALEARREAIPRRAMIDSRPRVLMSWFMDDWARFGRAYEQIAIQLARSD